MRMRRRRPASPPLHQLPHRLSSSAILMVELLSREFSQYLFQNSLFFGVKKWLSRFYFLKFAQFLTQRILQTVNCPSGQNQIFSFRFLIRHFQIQICLCCPSSRLPIKIFDNSGYQKAQQPKNRKARVAMFNQEDKENMFTSPEENVENVAPPGYTQPPFGSRSKTGVLHQVRRKNLYLQCCKLKQVHWIWILIQNFAQFDPDPRLCYKFWKKKLQIISEKNNFLYKKIYFF